MKIRLGYACISNTLNITSSGTLTYKNYLKLKDKANIKLDKVIKSNFRNLKEILIYNIKNGIYFFRMTSNLIPLGTHPQVDFKVFDRYESEFNEIGKIINENNLRVDIHPDQFCVLNSENEDVVISTIRILEFYQNMLKKMNLKTYMILHIGGRGKSKEEGINRFINNFKRLNKELQQMIVLENDDKIYNIKDTLKICEELKIPMCLDYHHFLCNKEDEKIEDYIERIFNTWKGIPKIHFSSPKNKKEYRAHNNYIDSTVFIDFLNKVKFIDMDFDIMIEAKAKDEAMFRLVRELKYKNFTFFNETSFFLK